MRIPMIQPDYRSGGAAIDGNWPVGWVPYLGDALQQAAFTGIECKDAMVNEADDGDLRALSPRNKPGVVMATAIPPMI